MRDQLATVLRALACAITLLAGLQALADDTAKTERVRPQMGFWAQVDGNSALLGEWVAGGRAFGPSAYALRGGGRIGKWDFFIQGEHGFYGTGTGASRRDQQVLCLGGGNGVRFFDDHMRSSVSVGAAILLTRSFNNQPGTTGFYVEARPAGFRWSVGRLFVVEFNPLLFSFVVPVTEGIPVAYLTFRTAVTLELKI